MRPEPILAALLASCLLTAAAPACADGAAVVITSTIEGQRLTMFFAPDVLTVAPGTTVTFENADGSNHLVKFADGQSSGRLKHHAVYARTFSAPGEYPYACAIHPQMTGRIIVE